MSRFILLATSLALLLAATCQSAPAIDSAEMRSCAQQPLEQQSSHEQRPLESEEAAKQARELELTNQQVNSAEKEQAEAREASGETEKRSYGYGGGSYSNGYQPAYSAPQVYYQNYPVVKHRPYYQNKPIVIPVPQPVPQPVPVIIPVYKPCAAPSTAAPTLAPTLVHYYKNNKDKVNKMLLAAMNYGDTKENQQNLEVVANKDTIAKNNQAHFLEQV